MFRSGPGLIRRTARAFRNRFLHRHPRRRTLSELKSTSSKPVVFSSALNNVFTPLI